jgi:hypothetical protein
MKTFFFAYHLANTVLLGVILIALTGRVPISWALTAFLAKFSADAWMIAAGQRALVQRGRLIEFVPMEVLYAAYNILVGPLGFLASFRWKTPS